MTQMIEVHDLVKNYGDFCAVNHISFSVPAGKIFGFLGPNGAGKTTTIKMLTTVLAPTSGTVNVNGHDPSREQKQVRRSFGIVFQDPSLDDELTAQENMDLHGILYGVPSTERAKRISMLLEFVGLEDRRKSLVKTFSGGMKRRLEVARALLHRPQDSVSRRANHRPRSADAQQHLEPHPTAQRGRGCDRFFHHALHGGGGPRGG